jgi:nitrogen fixation protein NifQ
VCALAVVAVDSGAGVYRALMSKAAGDGNDHVFACMIASWQAGEGALPDWLGLSPAAFRCLMAHHFPGMGMGGDTLAPLGRELYKDRVDEVDDLVRLMLIDKAGESPSEVWMAHVVAAGCMADDHLWHDLGLWCREDLTELMRRNFPALAALNVRDMKWKRFLYKQLCAADGIYTCRAPTCGVCVDYHVCFGPR